MEFDQLIEFWKGNPVADSPGFKVHCEDRKDLLRWIEEDHRRLAATTNRQSFGHDPKGAIHLNLSPVPYVGSLRTADIFVAMTNPTVGEQDYVDGDEPDFQMMLQRNLNQLQEESCFALEKISKWPSWSDYYRRLFNRFVRDYSRCSPRFVNRPEREREEVVWAELKSRVAILELIPYYSQNADYVVASGLHQVLPSSLAAKRALQKVADERSKTDAYIICRWKKGPERWGIRRERCAVGEHRGGLSAGVRHGLGSFLDQKPLFNCGPH